MTMLDLFGFCLSTIFIVTLIWPINILLMALAYKVRLGAQAIPLGLESFWLRSTFASLGLAVQSGVWLFLIVLSLLAGLLSEMGNTYAVIPALLLMAYVPLAAWFLFWIFQLEDFLQGLSLFGIYVLLPGLPFMLIALLLGLRRMLLDMAAKLS